MKSIRQYFLKTILFCISSVMITNTTLAQFTDPGEQPLAIEQERMELKNELDSRITYVEQTIDALEQNMDNVDQLNQEEIVIIDQLETSLKIYKNSLLSKRELIDDQTNQEWDAFKRRTEQWCKEVEFGLSNDLQELENELTIN